MPKSQHPLSRHKLTLKAVFSPGSAVRCLFVYLSVNGSFQGHPAHSATESVLSNLELLTIKLWEKQSKYVGPKKFTEKYTKKNWRKNICEENYSNKKRYAQTILHENILQPKKFDITFLPKKIIAKRSQKKSFKN